MPLLKQALLARDAHHLVPFTFYWLDGKRQVLMGLNAMDACNRNSIGQIAIRALDFWAEGDNNDYAWVPSLRKWSRIIRAS